MTEPLNAEPGGPDVTPPQFAATAPQTPAATSMWSRIKEHKVAQWTLAYAAAAYTLLHGTEMLSEAQEWPHLIVRLLSLLLVLGVPVVMVLAWYHGAKGLKRISGPELMIITLLGIIAGSVLWGLSRSNAEKPVAVAVVAATPAAATPAAESAPPRTAVAVLPFANLTGDASKDYLGDGMAEELINTLAKVEGLKVPARTSTFAYKGRNTDIRQIAKDLGVGTILEGSVRAAGKRIRITAQLINAQDGLHLWSETYDEEFTDIFKLQDKLASEIATALRPSLHNAAAPLAHVAPTQDVEAYQLYLQGVYFNERPTIQNFAHAIELFSKAVVRDPGFARAYGEMADAHFGLYLNGQPQEHLAEAEKLARKALAFGQETPRALDSLAGISLLRGHWLEMEDYDRTGLAQTDATTLLHRSYHLAAAGKLRAAIEASRQAYKIAPASPLAIGGLAEHLALLGEDEEAGKFADLALQTGLDKTFVGLVNVYSRAARKAGQYAKAADVLIDGIDANDTADAGARSKEIVRLVHAALADKRQRAAALAARARLYPPNRRLSASANALGALRLCMLSAKMYVLLDAIDAAYSLAFQCLDEQPVSGAVPGADTRGYISFWSPEMRPFRRDPRFQAFVTRIGLMDYWKQYGPPDDCDLKNGKLTCH